MKTTEIQKEKGRIRTSGMGGFLNPPTHPEHSFSVEFDLRKRPENRGSCSLTSAVEDNDWLTDSVREEAKKLLTDWKAPAIDSEEVKKWIYQVLGYFANCYQAADGSWSASDLRILDLNPFNCDLNPDRPNFNFHAGINLIRKYYPDYTPSELDFRLAKWGN